MSRWVVPEGPSTVGTGKNGDAPDGVLGRIVKYVPTEVVTGYTALFTALTSMDIEAFQSRAAAALLIALFLIATLAFVWIYAPKSNVRWAHMLVAPFAFIAWAYPISSGLLGDWFVPLIAFGLQAMTVALAIFVKPQNSK